MQFCAIRNRNAISKIIPRQILTKFFPSAMLWSYYFYTFLANLYPPSPCLMISWGLKCSKHSRKSFSLDKLQISSWLHPTFLKQKYLHRSFLETVQKQLLHGIFLYSSSDLNLSHMRFLQQHFLCILPDIFWTKLWLNFTIMCIFIYHISIYKTKSIKWGY